MQTTLEDDRKPELTPKALRTRATILETALSLFATQGYQATSMREIAAAAGCSLGLAYRYFSCKEELVVAVYEMCTDRLARQTAALPRVSMATRYALVVRASLANLAPYRESCSAISGIALSPTSGVGVLSERMSYLRSRGWSLFHEVVAGARDFVRPADAGAVTTLLYASYLLVLLFWVQDNSPDQSATDRLIGFAEFGINRVRPLLRMRVVSQSATVLADILAPMFGAGSAA